MASCFRLKRMEERAGKIYAVNSIPHSVLIDKKGVIIASNLRGEELLKNWKKYYIKSSE